MSFWANFCAFEPDRKFTWNPEDPSLDYWRVQDVKFFFDDPTYYTTICRYPVNEDEHEPMMTLTEDLCNDLSKHLKPPVPEFVLPWFALEESSLVFTDTLPDGPAIRDYFEKGWNVFFKPTKRS